MLSVADEGRFLSITLSKQQMFWTVVYEVKLIGIDDDGCGLTIVFFLLISVLLFRRIRYIADGVHK